ncbi:MAG: hypothetical protein D6698_16615 [Gammaproteobacteria bacterium]|nr:MAG: hypothetical protein D6698_16615 [Gammaproteobacteria bacterium]
MILVLYHYPCTDGFTAAWVAHRALSSRGERVRLLPRSYGEPFPTEEAEGAKQVFILDFSYRREVLEPLMEKYRITVIDHHATAQKDLEGLPNVFFDMNRSGAGLTWDYFFPENERLRLVHYVEDRDLWRFQHPHSMEVNAYIGTFSYSISEYNRLASEIEEGLYEVRDRGAAVLRYIEKGASLLCDYARKQTFLGYEAIPVVNAPPFLSSEVGHRTCHGSLFSVSWFVDEEGFYVYSLRSDGGFDVSALAKTQGGGGHRAAAGFRSRKSPEHYSKGCG